MNNSPRLPGLALRGALTLILISMGFLFPAPVSAQEEVIPLLEGQVLAGTEPLGGAMVVLHQVSMAMSGEIDSIQAGPDGAFTLRLPRVPDHGAESEVYFASVRYRGLLYLGPAVTGPMQLDSLYLIQAYDTVSVPAEGAELALVQRSIFLDKVEAGWEATDFFQVIQEGDRTVFSPEDGVVWSYPLPEGATDFQLGQSDLSPDAFQFNGGRFEVYSPLPPGDRFFLVRYSLPDDDLVIPTPGLVQRMEVLVREPGPQAEFTHLAAGMPVELEPGNVFRSYEGLNLQVPEIEGRIVGGGLEIPAQWLGLFLAALLGGIGVWGYRRGTGPTPEPESVSQTRTRGQLLVTIAELDEGFEGQRDTSPKDRERYQSRRAALVEQLKIMS
jgi:hypothetical protein